MRRALSILLASMLALGAGPAVALAQVRTIDPNVAIDSDLAPASAPAAPTPPPSSGDDTAPPAPAAQANPPSSAPAPIPGSAESAAQADAASGQTFSRDELFSAAEATFGKGASGLAGILERTLKEQGRPNAYISGREASGAFVVGLRYGSGTLFHKVEGQQPVYWTGPSVGFDLGGDANKVFVLVYNLYDSEELYRRFPAAEGRLYFVGGFAATYLRRDNIVLIPIRLGVGWRQGVNVGYMKFSHKTNWFPF